uniref:Uncharacterized protein n=1 Tax=Anguilla anguilla TaxID=7936 RepID=A0A0E9SA71_ANGAN
MLEKEQRGVFYPCESITACVNQDIKLDFVHKS